MFRTIKKFYNWGPCEFSGRCSFEKVRLGLAIVKNQKYCLIDKDGDIRATASNIDGIISAKSHYG